MAVAWLRPRSKPLSLLKRETETSQGTRAHCVSAWDILWLTHGLAEWPSLLPCIFGETAARLTFPFLECSTPSFLSSTLASSKPMPLQFHRGRWALLLGDSFVPSLSRSRDPWVSPVSGRICDSRGKYLWNFMNETGRLTASCHVGDVSHQEGGARGWH